MNEDIAPPLEQEDDGNLVQCEITGKMVPDDEIVEIQGRRVCAEGKAILLDQLRSGEKIGNEMERPTVLRRFGCIFLDGIIFGLINVGLMVVFMGSSFLSGKASGDMLAGQGWATLVGTVLTLIYYTLMHGLRGQTLGKMAGKLKVVNLDGSDIDMRTAFLRALYYIGPNLITATALIFISNLTVIQVFNIVVSVYGLTNVIFALVDRERQRALHDRFAGTRVIAL